MYLSHNKSDVVLDEIKLSQPINIPATPPLSGSSQSSTSSSPSPTRVLFGATPTLTPSAPKRSIQRKTYYSYPSWSSYKDGQAVIAFGDENGEEVSIISLMSPTEYKALQLKPDTKLEIK